MGVQEAMGLERTSAKWTCSVNTSLRHERSLSLLINVRRPQGIVETRSTANHVVK